MNNPFDYIPDAECDQAFRELTARIEALKGSAEPEDIAFVRELEAGKMLGVLIAADSDGLDHTLYAFSGQLGDGGFHYPGFVGPVFDYLRPDGYFKTKEAEISRQNVEISIFEKDILSTIGSEYEHAKEKCEAEIAEYKEKCRLSKITRDTRRDSGANEDEIDDMIRQSQFEKAELHRLKKRTAATLLPYATRLKEAEEHLYAMKEKRRADSEALQKWLFSSFRLLNARGETKSLDDIFAETPMRIPPSGAGECCAPKLLQEAYMRGWTPRSMAEYWYGKPKKGELRVHGAYYPACRGKCLPVLSWMLQGLSINPPLDADHFSGTTHEPEIIYENEWFCVVCKPSGMLSVPGKGAAVSLQQWLSDKYGESMSARMAHRLDQDTSGLMIATFGQQSYKAMQTLFATRQVQKTYVADLAGNYKERGLPHRGQIDLPLSPDWFDRPRQRIDIEAGKPALTDYEFMGNTMEISRVIFRPHTGRTHQLRVHAASEIGLGIPIVGDRLYGRHAASPVERLHLHAHRMEFTFPLDGKHYIFESPVPF